MTNKISPEELALTDAGKNRLLISFAPFATWSPHFETELEIIQNHLDCGGKALILSCGGNLKICEPNPKHELLLCAVCKSRFQSGVRWLNGIEVRQNVFYSLTNEQKFIIHELSSRTWRSFDELRSFMIEGADVGLSAASSIISFLREPEPDIELYQDIVKKHVETAVTVFFSIKNQLIKYNPDSLLIFNGRFSSLRPALRAAQLLGKDCDVHERASDIDKYSVFKNTYPHNLRAIKEQMQDVYFKSTLNDYEKRKLALNWFEERRKGVDQAWPSLIKHQQLNLLPDFFTSDKINVVIFISSDDEYMACAEWDNPYYLDQNKAIASLMDDIGDDTRIRVFVRVHPILKGVKNTQTKNINMLAEKYKSIHIIPAESLVHSYSLIDAADVVITYGSTVGIEASYAGKLSILMGRALYDSLGVCVCPKSHGELVVILRDIASGETYSLPSEREFGLVKFGLFNRLWGESFNYLDPTGLYSAQMIRNGKITNIKANFGIRLIYKISNILYASLNKLRGKK